MFLLNISAGRIRVSSDTSVFQALVAQFRKIQAINAIEVRQLSQASSFSLRRHHWISFRESATSSGFGKKR